MVRAVSCVAVAALFVAACSPDDDTATPPTDPTTAPANLEPIPPITTAATPTAPTTTPPTTTPPTVPVTNAPATSAPTGVWLPAIDPPATFPTSLGDAGSLTLGPAVRIGDAPAFEYDVSPDGQWTASIRSGEICLAPVGDPSSAACAAPEDDLGPVQRAWWSPDSSAVVWMTDIWGDRTSGIELLHTDGRSTVLVQPGRDDLLPFEVVFSSPDRVAVLAITKPSRELLIAHLDLANGDGAELGRYVAPDGTNYWMPMANVVVSTDSIVATMPRIGGTQGPFDIWQFPLDGGQPSIIVVDAYAAASSSNVFDQPLVPLSISGGVMLTHASYVRGNFQAAAQRGDTVFAVHPAKGGAPVPVPNRPDRFVRDAQLSPDGRYLAVLGFYTGDDPSVRDAALHQFSVVTVASILAGEPVWTDLAALPAEALAQDVGQPGSAIVWADPGVVLLEMSDGVYAIEVAPAA